MSDIEKPSAHPHLPEGMPLEGARLSASEVPAGTPGAPVSGPETQAPAPHSQSPGASAGVPAEVTAATGGISEEAGDSGSEEGGPAASKGGAEAPGAPMPATTVAGSATAPSSAPHASAATTAPPTAASEAAATRKKVISELRTVFDPEIPVNIYDLGLIYEIEVAAFGIVNVTMTLTAPGCPVADSLVEEVRNKIAGIPEVSGAYVNLVWDPPWTKERMSDAARLELNMLY